MKHLSCNGYCHYSITFVLISEDHASPFRYDFEKSSLLIPTEALSSLYRGASTSPRCMKNFSHHSGLEIYLSSILFSLSFLECSRILCASQKIASLYRYMTGITRGLSHLSASLPIVVEYVEGLLLNIFHYN